MNNEEDLNYLSNYQSNYFEEQNSDEYQSVDVKRKCLIQTLKACTNLANEQVACDFIEEELKEYSELVDDQSKINNYAATVQNLVKNLNKTYCQEWKNDLKVEDFDDIIQSLQCCSYNEATEQDINKLFRKKTPVILQPVKLHENTTKVVNNSIKNNLQSKITSDEPQTVKRNNCGMFKTARDELETQNVKKFGKKTNQQPQYEPQKKSLGPKRGVYSKFVPPVRTDSPEEGVSSLCRNNNSPSYESDEIVDERLKNIDPRMVELIRSEIMDSSAPIKWDDIAGLEFAKSIIKEVVVWPLLRPDIFTGLRRPPKGILLFGPPGTGKTLIGKCIASQSQSTFFSISASSLTSKWIGDGEKMVRAMFAVARCHQPAVIFIDEIDSLLSQRSETEHESSRRIKTEFLVQLDGAATGDDDRILVIGATNRPQELDEAARRRFVKRLYIPLPEKMARLEIVKRLMSSERNELSEENMTEISELSNGYSGADMKNLCAEASLGPIRSIDISMIENIQAEQVRPITMQDFHLALNRVRASVSPKDLEQYITWNRTYGAGGF